MRRLTVFNQVSLDGYFTDANGDMSFARKDNQDAEWNTFAASNAKGGGMLLFGRVTYELMASFWHTAFAAETMPPVAKRMNNLPKIVFSRTMDKVSWNNTRLVKVDMTGETRKMKKEPGEDMAILGSGSSSSAAVKKPIEVEITAFNSAWLVLSVKLRFETQKIATIC